MDRYRWAERRDGLVTTQVLKRSGHTKRTIERERTTRRVRTVRRGVVAVNGSPRTWQQEVRAVLLAAGDHVAAAHVTAIRAWGCDPGPVDGIHVLTELGRQVTMPGVIAHRSGSFADGDVVERALMRVTSPLRTVIDVSGTFGPERLGQIVDDLIRRRLLKLEDLRRRVDVLRPAPGRSLTTLRAVLAARLPGYHPGESALETRIVRVIDSAGLERPTQQFRLVVDGHRYRLDFAWPDRRTYLEGNGFGFHSLASDLDRDARRQNDLVLCGWRPIEITWRMSDREIRDTIARALRL